MAEVDWEPVFSGNGLELRRIQAEIETLGIPVVATAREMAPYSGMVGRLPEMTLYTLSVPSGVLEARRDELAAIVQRVTGDEVDDIQAIRDAEEDYDVRACPN